MLIYESVKHGRGRFGPISHRAAADQLEFLERHVLTEAGAPGRALSRR
jgi:hypothetical protein